MDAQLSFATLDYAGKKKRTKREMFLAEMAAAVPWSVLEVVIAPHYPKEGPQGRCRSTWSVVAMSPGYWSALRNFGRRRGPGRGRSSRSSSFRSWPRRIL